MGTETMRVGTDTMRLEKLFWVSFLNFFQVAKSPYEGRLGQIAGILNHY